MIDILSLNQEDTDVKVMEIYQAKQGPLQPIPLFNTSIPAGFPSPADDDIDMHLDLNEHMVKHPAATFFVKVEGESMRDAGILSGDILVVDRSLTPLHGKIIVAVVNGDFTVKRMVIKNGRVFLAPENPSYKTIEINESSQFHVWGVVTYVIHKAQ